MGLEHGTEFERGMGDGLKISRVVTKSMKGTEVYNGVKKCLRDVKWFLTRKERSSSISGG